MVRGLVPDPDRRTRCRRSPPRSGPPAPTPNSPPGSPAVRERLLARRYGPAAQARRGRRSSPPRCTRSFAGSAGRCAAGRAAGDRGCSVARGASAPAARRRAPAPEQLYEQGSLRAAADGVRAAGRAAPAVAGALVQSRRRLLPDGRRGASRGGVARGSPAGTPRAPTVRRALELTPPPDRDVRALDLVAAGHAGGAAAAGRAGLDRGLARHGSCGPRVRDRWTILLVFAASAIGWRARAPCLVPAAASPWCWTTPRSDSRRTAARPRSRPVEGGSAVRLLRRAPGWVLVAARPATREGGSRPTRSRRSAARFSPCRAASPSCPTPSPTRSPPARWSSGPPRWSRSWWRTRSTPARATCGSSWRTAARR